MLKVGLTGSIAVGKSYVCSVFRDLGCHVLDADLAAREVVRKGEAGLEKIRIEFGDRFIRSDGELDRAKLAETVFSDKSKLELLNSIVHPLVFEYQDKWLNEIEARDPYGIAIIDAALMIESGGYKRLDKLIVVYCDPEIQLQRLMLRDSLSGSDARRRIASQMPQEEKKQYADLVIDTSNGFEDTRRQTTEVFNSLTLFTKAEAARDN
jgi:dephospho-CoA kinase